VSPASDGRPVLVLGGTREARELAAALDRAGLRVVSSLAGRLVKPRFPAGTVRIGGFGGADGLTRWLAEHDIIAVVDATHPFAQRISASARAACAAALVPLIRIERPGWTEQPGDRWHRVDDLGAAATLAPRIGSRVLLTIGRQGVSAFADDRASWYLIRCVERPEPSLPPRHELMLSRGPYFVEGELALIDSHGIDLIVTKDSGGASTIAKLEAARLRAVPVVVIGRPKRQDVVSVPDVAGAIRWVEATLSLTPLRESRRWGL
jgi:precorrin-6A/cobalt-precorrin-6A reductase